MLSNKMKWSNNGFRTINETAAHPDIIKTLDDWKRWYETPEKCVLIGGLAVDFYIGKRPSQDIDLLFLSDSDLPKEVYSFKYLRPHSFIHLKTHVEIEFVTPIHVNANPALFKKVFDTAIESDGIKIASPLGLIALKLGRFKANTDQVDIKELIVYCKLNSIPMDFSNWELSQMELDKFNDLYNQISDKIDENHYVLETNYYFRTNQPYNKFDIGDCQLYIFREEWGEPRFNFGRNMQKYIAENIDSKERLFSDFQFCLRIHDLEVTESSTGFNSFVGFKEEEKLLKEWLKTNREMVIKTWNDINSHKWVKESQCNWNLEVIPMFTSLEEFRKSFNKK